MSVLIVDDIRDTLRMYGRYFEHKGVRVETAADGIEALRLIAQRRPDVIVLDLAMPRMTGWEVLLDLKRRPETQGIPVIVLSGQNAEDGALTLGADVYLEKPCLPEALLRATTKLHESPKPGTRTPAPPQRESARCQACGSGFAVEYHVEPGGIPTPLRVTCPRCAADTTVTLRQPPLLFSVNCVGE
jgi:CheY-like chemotaxis protein